MAYPCVYMKLPKLPLVTKAEIKRIVDEMEREQQKEAEGPTPRKGKCPYCEGTITEEFHTTYTRPLDMIPFGPGSKQYIRKESGGLFCEDCGLKFEKMPKSGVIVKKKK